MKSVLTTAAVLIFIATPVLAQSFDPDVGAGNITPSPVASQNGTSAYGQTLDAYETDIPVLRHLGRYIIPRIDRGALEEPCILWRICLLTGLLQRPRL